MNVAAADRRWIAFRVLDAAGAPAEGAIVSFTAGERRLRRDVRAGYSYLASSAPRAHAGLGDVTAVTGVTVQWVDGQSEAFGDFEAGRVVTLRRGEGG